MRGAPERQMAMLTTLSPEDVIPAEHPIRRIRTVVDEVLASLDGEFEAMYSAIGRPSVPPEQLLKATVLMALYSIRSERAFCELRPTPQVVLGPSHRRGGLRPHHVHQEPGAPARSRDRRPVLLGCGLEGQALPLHLERALLRGRDAP
jgi:Transposase domain (DUF772)